VVAVSSLVMNAAGCSTSIYATSQGVGGGRPKKLLLPALLLLLLLLPPVLFRLP